VGVPLCYYGSPVPPPARRVLRAGPLSAVYEAGDLRYVKHGRLEVCRRWYAAVRDRNWGTVPGAITDERIEETADGFHVAYTSTHRQGDIHFVWRAEIVGTPSGITFTFDGEAKNTFLRNRIGFCVLHPPETCAGQPVVLNGTEQTKFPYDIAPQNPFHELRELSHTLPYGGRVSWTFDGDLFETEDQRNWTDASFKTFCTPLRLPFPVEVKAGDRVRQVVALRVEDVVPPTTRERPPDELYLHGEEMGRLPEIGLATAHHGAALTARELQLLRLLRPTHLRVGLDLTTADVADRLRRAAADAGALGTALELAVTVSDDAWAETKHLIECLCAVNPPLARVLAFHHREWATPARIVTPVVEAGARFDASVPVLVGTTANFMELNRGRPDLTAADGVCYSVQPQEHAFDNASLVECCGAIWSTVWSTRRIWPDAPIAVTPITLRKRVNPYATGPAAPVPPGELPPTVDSRQMALFGAVWTLAALKYLAETGMAVASVTFFETTGWLGVMERETGCPLPELFPSKPGAVFPLFHVLADASEFADAHVFRCESPDPLRFEALALHSGTGLRVMLANMTAEPQTVTIEFWFRNGARVRTLDEATFDRATTDPLAFRADPGETVSPRDGQLTLTLRPYAYVRIDG
jgi:D-apionolactonase